MSHWLGGCSTFLAFTALAIGQYSGVGFEAASLKRSSQSGTTATTFHGCRGGPGTQDPSLWSCENVTLADLVEEAFAVDQDRLVAPGWAKSVEFDVKARVP